MKYLLVAVISLIGACTPQRNPAEEAVERHFTEAFKSQNYRFGTLTPTDTLRLRDYYRHQNTEHLYQATVWLKSQLHPPPKTKKGTVYRYHLDKAVDYRLREDSLRVSANPQAWYAVRYEHQFTVARENGGRERQATAALVVVDTAYRVLEVNY